MIISNQGAETKRSCAYAINRILHIRITVSGMSMRNELYHTARKYPCVAEGRAVSSVANIAAGRMRRGSTAIDGEPNQSFAVSASNCSLLRWYRQYTYEHTPRQLVALRNQRTVADEAVIAYHGIVQYQLLTAHASDSPSVTASATKAPLRYS